MQSDSERILVIQTAFLGDVVLTTPLLQELRSAFPRCYLAVLVIPETSTILEGHPAIDKLLIFDKKNTDRGLKGLRKMSRILRPMQFDRAILPHRSFRSALVALLSGIPARVGYWQSSGFWLYTHRVWRDSSQHEVDRCMALLHGLIKGPMRPGGSLSIGMAPMERADARAMLEDLGVRSDDRLLAISPGSVWGTKRWTEEGFAAVADHFAQQEGLKVVLLGSPKDRRIADCILGRCRHQILDLTGQTSLRQLASLLAHCSVLLTNDNGSMHIGEAVETPIVAIFGSTTLNLGYGPRNQRAIVVERFLSCRPCGRHGHQRCPLDHFKCMKEIKPEEVISAVEKQLALKIHC